MSLYQVVVTADRGQAHSRHRWQSPPRSLAFGAAGDVVKIPEAPNPAKRERSADFLTAITT
jgi:hypothetical protein